MEKKTTKKIPESWENTPNFITRTEMLQFRRRKSIPDPSFDLDGDGSVGPHDLFLATKFDIDKDGKLNKQEFENALKAIKGGYADNFVWGCESSGLNRSFRLVQKRGKIITDEDFGQIRETYPTLETSQRTLTKSQLENMRKTQAKEESKLNELRVNTKVKEFLPLESFLDKDHYISNPKYPTLTNKKEAETKIAREKAGLSENPKDLKTEQVNFYYLNDPKNLSFSDMKTNRRVSLVNKLNNSIDFSHITFYEKIEKEKSYNGANGRMLRDTIMERKKKDVEHFEKTFTNRALGIHGKELPKFVENLKEYRDGSQSFGGKTSTETFENPFSNTKEYHKIEPKSDEVTIKPNQILHQNFESSKKNNLNSNFSGFHSNFMPYRNKIQEVAQELQKYAKSNIIDKKQFRFLSSNEITPPITQRLLQKNLSPSSKFKSVTSTGFQLER